MKEAGIIIGMAIMLLFQSCSTKHTVTIEPVKVEPVHIAIDVNIRVDRALDNFFEDIDKADSNTNKTSEEGK